MKTLLTILAICMITLASAEKSIAEDLNGANKTITTNSGSAWTTAYTNSSATTANLIVQPTSDLGEATNFSGQLTGNLRLVVHLKTNQLNISRLVLTNTNNTFTGGLYIEQGTVRVDNYAYIGGENGRKQIDMLHGSLMTNLDFNGFTINLTGDISNDERGAIRLSGTTGGSTDGGNFDAYITGSGSLEIVNDNPVTLTNTSNDYQGKTYIGSFAWRYTKNADPDPLDEPATLKLGANGVLPDTTVVIFGGDGAGTPTTGVKTLDLCGHNETVAGIFNSDTQGIITSDESATLTIKTKLNESNSYAGIIKDNVSLVITGSGTQTLTGANTYNGTTTITSGMLNLSGEDCTLGFGAFTIESEGVLLLTNAFQGMKNVSALSGNGEIRADSGYNYLCVTSSEPQSYSGTINVPESYRIDIGYNDGTNHSTNTNLPNATVSLNGSGSILGLIHGNDNESTLFTIGTLNGVEGSVVRESGVANTSQNSFSTLTVGQGNFAGTIGNTNANQSKLGLVKNTSGTLTLSGANTYTGGTTISDGTLKLSGAGTLGAGAVTVDSNATLEIAYDSPTTTVNIPSITMAETSAIKVASGTVTFGTNSVTLNNLSGGGLDENDNVIAFIDAAGKELTLNNDAMTTFIGSITAQKITVNTLNDVALKLYADANNKVTAESLTVSSGELDFKGYFEGNIEVFNGSVFSPGNSVGTADITGNITFAGATADSNGVALFEFGEYADGADVNHDLFVMENGGIFTADDGVILLDFANHDENLWATAGNKYLLVSGGGFADGDDNYANWLASTPDYSDLFKLTGIDGSLYLVGLKAAPEPGSGVPEPSTWALLALGIVVLFLRKRVRN